MRHAAVAGHFYPADKGALKRQINGFFSSLDIASVKNKDVKAMIVPHAGYSYSGKCAAFTYKHLDNKKFDSVIILGTNHSGIGNKFSLSIEDFDTPFGTVDCDMELVEEIALEAKRLKLDLTVNEQAHRSEHSIEVQLPFLQHSQKKLKMVPILVKDLSLKEIKDFGVILARMVKKEKKKILVIASSDFTHYGRDYGFVPFMDNVRENLYSLDNSIIEDILKLDSESFLKEAGKSTVCGLYAIACLIEFSKNMKLKADKVCYYTSGDVSKDWSAAVSYAGIVFS